MRTCSKLLNCFAYIYWKGVVDLLCWLGAYAAFIYVLIQDEVSKLIVLGVIAFYFTYPVAIEILYKFFSWLFYNDKEQALMISEIPTLPIVYHSDYNITACGIEKYHTFDSCKYGRVREKLLGLVEKVHQPSLMSRQLLVELGMSEFYLLKHHYPTLVSLWIELPIFFLPAFFVRSSLLYPMYLASSGTIEASLLALKFGWAVNLSGGYHHATLNRGGGFCIYPDISLAIRYLRRFQFIERIMVIDLDAHQGNGHERDALHDNTVHIVDFYNHKIYPGDRVAKQAIAVDVHIDYNFSDHQYCDLLKEKLKSSFAGFKPQFVIYNAGTDCLQNDPLGRMNLTQEGIKCRDELVYQKCREEKVPFVYLLSGGYHRNTAAAIAESLANIIKQQLLIRQ